MVNRQLKLLLRRFSTAGSSWSLAVLLAIDGSCNVEYTASSPAEEGDLSRGAQLIRRRNSTSISGTAHDHVTVPTATRWSYRALRWGWTVVHHSLVGAYSTDLRKKIVDALSPGLGDPKQRSLASSGWGSLKSNRRAYARVPRNRGPNTTLHSSMSVEGMEPSLAVKGSTTREIFEAYVERVLLPFIDPGHTIVMDNLSAHKGDGVSELMEERSCGLFYLPPYSPFNPVEGSFSRIERLYHKAQALTRKALVEEMSTALCVVKDALSI